MNKPKHFPSVIKTFGSSMSPLLRNGDVVFLKKANYSRLNVSDIVCVKKGGIIFTHRIIYKSNKYIITKGDHNIISDGKVFPKQIIGIAYKVKRAGQIITLKDIYLFQSTYYFQEIIKITKTFEKEKISFIFLKGLPLHLYYEKTHPNRIYSDCDILVDKKNKKKVRRILLKLKFKPDSEKQFVHLQKFLGSEIKELIYYKNVDNFIVRFDIHYEINIFSHIAKLPFPYLQKISDKLATNIVDNKKIVEINGYLLPILDYDDLIIYLLLHFFGHSYSGAFRLDFIKTLVSESISIDKTHWNDIILRAKSYGVLNFFIPGVYLLKEFYGIKVPYDILSEKYGKQLSYSVSVFNLLLDKNCIFNDLTSTYSGRFKRALFLLLLSEENLFKKLFYLLQPNLVLHFFYFVFIYTSNHFIQKRHLLKKD